MTATAYGFGVQDCKIAPRTGAGAWGAAVDVESVQLAGVQFNTVNAQLEGDDIIVDSHARIIGANVRIRFGFKSLAVFEVLTGQADVDSGDDKYIVFADENLPYFGMCARIDHTEGGGDNHLWIPKIKLMEGFEMKAEYSMYQIPEITAQAVKEDDTHGIGVIIQHDTAMAIVIPPAFGE